ncbi:MAG: LysR family transcriptional regulator [Pseudomonadota bacterium]
MDNWEEVKTAYTVGLLGTVTAASDALGVHRATVIRHIDSLEEKLGQKLFIRHTNGYTPTEAGEELIRVVKVTNDQFKGLSGRIKGQSASIRGELIVTSLDALAPLILPSIKEFHEKHQEARTVFIASEQILHLEYGEAHIALRPGPKPDEEDNKVIPYGTLKFGLFATQEYIEKHGRPKNMDDLKNHRFISRYDYPRTHFEKWVKENIPHDNIVFQGTTPFLFYQGVINHIGIGFLASFIQKEHPNLVEVLPADEKWHVPLWLVVHQDLYRTEKVEAFLEVVEEKNMIKG